MARSETDHILPLFSGDDFEQKIMSYIWDILRKEYRDERCIPKLVSKRTGLPPDSIRKWKKGRYFPRLDHFLLLAKHYPAIREALLAMMDHDSLPVDAPDIPLTSKKTSNSDPKSEIYCARFLLIKVLVDSEKIGQTNQRQLWFLGLLQQGEQIKAEHIAAAWNVSLRMARYDVGELVKKGLIRLDGARKNGWYEAI